MIRNIYLDGKIKTLLVLQDEEGAYESMNPVYQALKDQADRIESLEQQNQTLIRQGEVLLKLLEISTETGNLLTHSINSLADTEAVEIEDQGEESLSSLDDSQREED